MYNDIEQLIDENLTLKKAFQVCKKHEEQLQHENQQLKEQMMELEENSTKTNEENKELFQRSKHLQSELARNNSTFISQIEELKNLIEEKERELENFQLKMIPSLDQDMLRVKLITEMEGPYQEVVDKKDREIGKLKDQLHRLKREKEMVEYSLNSKEKEFKREVEEIRKCYQLEIDGLQKHISHISGKIGHGKIEKDIIKTYKNEIDQLRSTLEFHKALEEEQRRELLNLRLEKEKLLADLANAHAHQAIEIRNTNNEQTMIELKSNLYKLEDNLLKIEGELERTKAKLSSVEMEKKKMQSNLESEIKDMKLSNEKERESYRNEILEFESEVRRLKEQKSKNEWDSSETYEKYRSLLLIQDQMKEEISSLRNKLNYNDQEISSRFKRTEDERLLRERIERELRETIEKEIIFRMREENKKGNESPKRDENFNETRKNTEKMKKLEEKIHKLTIKLEFANSKIMELLREKAQSNEHLGRNRSMSLAPEHDNHKVFLEHRDCSFVPLCPPVILEPLQHFL